MTKQNTQTNLPTLAALFDKLEKVEFENNAVKRVLLDTEVIECANKLFKLFDSESKARKNLNLMLVESGKLTAPKKVSVVNFKKLIENNSEKSRTNTIGKTKNQSNEKNVA